MQNRRRNFLFQFTKTSIKLKLTTLYGAGIQAGIGIYGALQHFEQSDYWSTNANGMLNSVAHTKMVNKYKMLWDSA
jgi:hypothetical protein